MDVSNDSVGTFSVLMSIYEGDNCDYLEVAFQSLFQQTLRPGEIVLVQDGAIPGRLASLVAKWIAAYPGVFRIVDLPSNVGLGKALQVGIESCSHDIVARMDADDISLSNRFEKQMKVLQEHPDVSLVNSWMAVFHEDPDRKLYVRKVPVTHEAIVRLAKVRSPINHPTVMYRRTAVLAAGNYPDRRKGQDYPLWVSMLQADCRMACLPEVLLKHRCDPNLAARRQDFTAYKYQMVTQAELLARGFITTPRYIANVAIRTVAYLVPTYLSRTARTALRM